MKIISLGFISFILVLNTMNCSNRQEIESSPVDYLGQRLPGMIPEIFAPGIVSTDHDEINAVFSPAMDQFFFSRDTYKNASKAGRHYTMLFMNKTDDGWTEPQVLPFVGEYMAGDMCVSHDGERMLFCTDRPLISGRDPEPVANIWEVLRQTEGWSDPRPVHQVNSDGNEWYPSLTKTGWLYFSSNREGGLGKSDIYRAKYTDGYYTKPENIGAPVNTEYSEGDVFIASNESYLIVKSSGRPDGLGGGDLYIHFRAKDGSWSEPVHMGDQINSPALEYCPVVSPDGKYFFFTSRRRGNDDVYWVDATVLENFRVSDSTRGDVYVD